LKKGHRKLGKIQRKLLVENLNSNYKISTEEVRKVREGMEQGGNKNYWCHGCQMQIEPIRPDLTCPNCFGEFIEEIEEDDPPTLQFESGDEEDEEGDENQNMYAFIFLFTFMLKTKITTL